MWTKSNVQIIIITMASLLLIGALGGLAYTSEKGSALANSRADQRRNAALTARQTELPPRPVREVLNDPDYILGRFRLVGSYPYKAGETMYILEDPKTGGLVYQMSSARGAIGRVA